MFNLSKYINKKGHNVQLIINDEIYRYFKKLDIDIYNIGSSFNYMKLLKENFGLSILDFSQSKLFGKTSKFLLGLIIRNLNYIKIRNDILNIIYEINPDVIHFHNPFVLELYPYLYKHLSIPKIYTLHGKDFEKHLNPINILNYLRKEFLLKSFSSITTVSKYGSKNIKIPVKIISNGIDYDKLKTLRESNDSTRKIDKTFKMMFSGGMKPNKGGIILLEAMKILNSKDLPIKLYYAGYITDDFKEKYRVENVIFTGFLNHEDYLEKLNKCNCLISLSELELFSISILEAMGLGKTVITTPVGGIPEFCFNNRNGLYVERNPRDIAEKILYLYKNPKLIERFFKNNIEDTKKFDWNRIVDQYISLYRSVIN